MKLSKFLKKDKRIMGINTLANLSGVNRVSIYNLINGRDVRGSVLIKLERATKGEVTAKEMYEEFVQLK